MSITLIKRLKLGKCLLVCTMLLLKRWILSNHWVNKMTRGLGKTCRKVSSITEVDILMVTLTPVTSSGQIYRYYLHQEGTCLGTHVTDINLSNSVKAWLCMANSHVLRLASTVVCIPTTTHRLLQHTWVVFSFICIYIYMHCNLLLTTISFHFPFPLILFIFLPFLARIFFTSLA